MKYLLQIAFIFISTLTVSQDCDPITSGATFIHDNLQMNILKGNNAFNELNLKTGIGQDGDLDSRTYTSLISASNIWSSGTDVAQNLKIGAGTYNESDWRPGILDESGQITADQCLAFDRIFSVTKEEIMLARDMHLNGSPCLDFPSSVVNWPGRSNSSLPQEFQDKDIADFWDDNMDGRYDACDGDFPLVSLRNCEPTTLQEALKTLPSKISFYAINDNGSIHDLTNGTSTQTNVFIYIFSFKTQEARDIIFFKYKTVNLAQEHLINYTFGQWVDFDLGCKENDLIGTDPSHKMVYAYNGTPENCPEDQQVKGQIGISILNGLYSGFGIEYSNGEVILVDPISNNLDIDTLIRKNIHSCQIPVDCTNQSVPNSCNPQLDYEFHNVLNGFNKDGSSILDPSGNPTLFPYSGNPAESGSYSLCNDDVFPSTTALIATKGNVSQPASQNEIIYAVFYTENGDQSCQDFAAIRHKQSQAQALYDNCFFHFNGPPTPPIIATHDVENGSNVMSISVVTIPSNYSEHVPMAPIGQDDKYKFEGIKIYQVKTPNFDFSEINNVNACRLVYQGDINNDVEDIFNFESVFQGGNEALVPQKKVTASNIGIELDITLDNDAFSIEPFDNSKKYYYFALSYGYNNYQQFDPLTKTGQQYPYIETTCGLNVISSNSITSTSTLAEGNIYTIKKYGQEWIINDVQKPLQMKIIGLDGRLISSQLINPGDELRSESVILNSSGMYLLTLQEESGTTIDVHKLVKIN